MANQKQKDAEPIQKTIAPEEKDRIDIPIPKRKDFFRTLKNAIKKPSRSGRTVK
jgi:hypothetical protein